MPKPRCEDCPVAAACAGRARAGELPVKAAKTEAPRVRIALAVVRRGGALLLERREAGLLAGTWGLPWVEGGRAELAAHVSRLVGARVEVRGYPAARGEHAFTHRRWEMRAYEVVTNGTRGEWRRPEEVALGSAHRRMLAELTPSRVRAPDARGRRRSP